MRYAVIDVHGAVVSSVVGGPDYDPGDGCTAVAIDDETPAYAGCTWTEAGGFVEPPRPVLDPAEIKAHLIAYAADKRWRVETGGITVGGVLIATDDRSKLMITGARIKADNDPAFVTPWVASDGSVSSIDAATVIAISDAVLSHVAACFVAYDEIKGDIEAGTITTTAEIDAADWP